MPNKKTAVLTPVEIIILAKANTLFLLLVFFKIIDAWAFASPTSDNWAANEGLGTNLRLKNDRLKIKPIKNIFFLEIFAKSPISFLAGFAGCLILNFVLILPTTVLNFSISFFIEPYRYI